MNFQAGQAGVPVQGHVDQVHDQGVDHAVAGGIYLGGVLDQRTQSTVHHLVIHIVVQVYILFNYCIGSIVVIVDVFASFLHNILSKFVIFQIATFNIMMMDFF